MHLLKKNEYIRMCLWCTYAACSVPWLAWEPWLLLDDFSLRGTFGYGCINKAKDAYTSEAATTAVTWTVGGEWMCFFFFSLVSTSSVALRLWLREGKEEGAASLDDWSWVESSSTCWAPLYFLLLLFGSIPPCFEDPHWAARQEMPSCWIWCGNTAFQCGR